MIARRVRRPTSYLVAAVAAATCVGCGRKNGAARPEITAEPEASPQTPKKTKPEEPFEDGVLLDVDGTPLRLAHGRARQRHGLIEIRLTKDALPCDATEPETLVGFDIAPGPKGAFYAGEEIDRRVFFDSKHPTRSGVTRRAQVKMEAFAPKKGAHLRGMLEVPGVLIVETPDGAPTVPVRQLVARGKGRFDVTLCDEDDDKQAVTLPAEAPPTPLALEIDGARVPIATAFALATRDQEGRYYTLAFYTAPARCVDGEVRPTTADRLVVEDIGRSSKIDLATDMREPADARYEAAKGVGTIGSNAWVRLHDISPTTLKGELVARTIVRGAPSLNALSAAGQFEATICGDW